MNHHKNMKQSNSESVQVLLIDDEVELGKSAKECMDQFGKFIIELVDSVEKAIEKINNNEYDVIVCDIDMPSKDGLTFLMELRKNGNQIPFIVFTVSEDKETATHAFKLGANGFIGKFGKPEIVFSTLTKCINNVIIKKCKQH